MKVIFRRGEVHYKDALRPGFTLIKDGVHVIGTLCKLEPEEHPSGQSWILSL